MWIGLVVNNEKAEYMVMSRDQTVGNIQRVMIGNKYFATAVQFKYQRIIIKNKSSI